MLNSSPLITIEVTPDIAAKIRFLAEEGVFTLDRGNVVLNIANGKLMTIKTERITHAQTIHTSIETTPDIHVKVIA